MDNYRVVSCEYHDHIELACIRNYPLKIELTDNTVCHGRALTTETRADKSEWLVIETTTQKRSIRLDQITAITPEVEGAMFGRILMPN